LKKLIIDCPAAIADRDTHFRFAWYGIPSLQVDLRTYDLCIRVKFDAVPPLGWPPPVNHLLLF
jgi:hypothetical protein